jgi:molybdopterin-synthase adenylyltransferase
MYEQKFSRNAFTAQQQLRVKKATFALIGLGGVGGFALENLLRMGAERFIVFDGDRFEQSNLNRQLLATLSSLGKRKTSVALARAKGINPAVRMRLCGAFTARSSLGNAEMLIDASDNVDTRLTASQLARKSKIPYVFSSASGTRGIVSVFRNYGFRTAFQVSGRAKGRAGGKIICPAAAFAGTLAASQAVNCILGKPFVKAPDALFFDVSSKRVFWRARLG